MQGIIPIVKFLVNESILLKDKYTNSYSSSIEFACIFCQNKKEEEKLTKEAQLLGKVIQNTPTGFTYLLHQPLKTKAGLLRLIKIRTPDPSRKERGDTDFNIDYLDFKKKYHNKPNFKLIKREDFEMLRLSDPDYKVMVCFSNIPLSQTLGIKKQSE